MPTSTVEDYLKRIHQLQRAGGDGPIPTGRIAVALGITPGSATAMMKTLAASGLVDYEPYSGVRLTVAGKKLAIHVLRRHRLIELFLVKVMGMDWSEVHEDAERLEHAVSETLIERMDAMLGHPAFDPHGDPIPTADGEIPETNFESLLACPLAVPVRVARVTDQESAFLKLLERHHVVPGRRLRVADRNEEADTVRLVPEKGGELNLGFRAAARVLVKTD